MVNKFLFVCNLAQLFQNSDSLKYINNGIQLTSADDMNTLTTPGVYRQGGTSIPANAPTATAYNADVIVLERASGAGFSVRVITQIWICTNDNIIYHRTAKETELASTNWVVPASKSDLVSQLKFGGDTKYIRSAFSHSDGVGNIRFGSDDSNYIYLDITSTGIAFKKCTNGEVVTIWTK